MIYQYWLANIGNISPLKIYLLYQSLGSASRIYYASDRELLSVQGIGEEEVKRIKEAREGFDPQKEWADFISRGIGFCTLESKDYPSRLRQICDPPYALFYKGKLPDPEQKAISIVGSRNRSAYGQAAALELGEYLARNHIPVISGLARGIDADSHKGAIRGNGKTYGILGCGVDVVYPKGNRYLYEEILNADGGIISEFPPGTQALALNFPRRNRIISGLTDCVVVIEAKEKSGSLITADFAMEQGKDIFALPGRISDPLSSGTNRLLHQGAGVYLSPRELLKDLNLGIISDAEPKPCGKNALEKEELLLYSLIDFVPVGIGTLMERTGFSVAKILKISAKLTALDLICEYPANCFVRTSIT